MDRRTDRWYIDDRSIDDMETDRQIQVDKKETKHFLKLNVQVRGRIVNLDEL